MHMSFWFSPNLGDFFFDGLTIVSSGAFAATCLFLLILTVGIEALKVYRTRLSKRLSLSDHAQSNERLVLQVNGNETSALLSQLNFRGKMKRALKVLSEVLLYLIQDSMSWIIMLAVMSFNGYIFLTVLAGAGFGYAFFGESLAHSKIERFKSKLKSKSCGECQVKDESAPGCSDPPIESLPNTLPPVVTVHVSAGS